MIALQPLIIHQPNVVLPIEQEILLAIRDGNEQAFETVFRQHYEGLCRYAGQFVADSDEAEEEVQAVFLALWEKRAGLIITVSLKAYLYRAVHNRCLNRIKHVAVRDAYQEHRRYVGESLVESPVQTLIGHELADHVQTAIQKLPEQCRRVFMLSRFDELTYGEIAGQLGISVKTVENQIGKALRILRTELSDYLPVAFLIMNTLKWMIDNVSWLINPGLLFALTMSNDTLFRLNFIVFTCHS